MFNLIPRKRENENPLSLFRDEVDSLFDRFFGRGFSPLALDEISGNGWGLELEDKGNAFVVRAEAPGFEAEDFDVQVQGNVLTIKAERKQETGEKEKDKPYAYAERRLHRAVTLPAGADANKIEAKYRNGILELHLPKMPEAQGRRVTVQKT